jgi:hypothetical protein
VQIADQPERVDQSRAQQLIQAVVERLFAQQPVAIRRVERTSDLPP